MGKGGDVALVPVTEGTVDSWMPNAPVERVRWGYGEVGYVAAPSRYEVHWAVVLVLGVGLWHRGKVAECVPWLHR